MTPRSSRRTYGITLKHDKKFHHNFNVVYIARIEAKQLKVSGELENLEKKETFDQIFKGLAGNYMSKKRQLKQNRRKSKGRKRKRFENNVQRVLHIERPNCLLYPPSMTIPEACINVEDIISSIAVTTRCSIHRSPTVIKLIQQRGRKQADYQP